MDTLLKISIFFFPLTWALCVNCTQAYDGSPTELLDYYLQSGNTTIEDTYYVPGDGVPDGTSKVGDGRYYASVQSCLENPCENDGTCKSNPEEKEGYECLCKTPFEGYNCEMLTFCVGVNCRDRGTCGLNEDKDDYECTCESPYTGKDCEIGCSKKCGNGEECYRNNDEEDCRCKENFIGGKSGCFECTCPENSICALKMNGTKEKVGCLCNEGYHFKDGLCKEICNPNPCRHGKCSHFGANSYSCKCNRGYIGVHCDEEDITWKETYDSYVLNTVIVGVVLGAALLVSVVLYGIKLRSLKRKGSFDLELQVRESKFYEMPTSVLPIEEQ